jgi:hypothetical protein
LFASTFLISADELMLLTADHL